LFTATHDTQRLDDANIVVRSLTSGEQKIVTQGADARYTSSGHLVFVRSGVLLVAPFDATRLIITGSPVAVLDDVMQSMHARTTSLDSGAAQFSVSSAGALAYASGGTFPVPQRALVWVDRSGTINPIDMPLRQYWAPRLAPDGQRLAVYSRGEDGRIWIHDFRSGTTSALTEPGGGSTFPQWTTDGMRVIFGARIEGPQDIYWRAVDSGRPPERLTSSAYVQVPGSLSPDGKMLAVVQTATAGTDIWMLTLGDGKGSMHAWLNA